MVLKLEEGKLKLEEGKKERTEQKIIWWAFPSFAFI